MAVDTLGHLLALHLTPADVGDCAAVARLAADIQEATGNSVDLAYVDQGYTGEAAAKAAAAEGIKLEVVKLPEAKRGFVLRLAVGSSKDPSPGPHVAGGSSKIMSDMSKHLPVCMSSPSSDTCSNMLQNW